MTRDEFTSLPLAIALGLIWDVASDRLKKMPRPDVPEPPKYDGRLPKGSGNFVWYSELDLDSLEYWCKKNRESAEQGGKFAERNKKAAATLAKWVAWRRLFPSVQWSGTRGEDRATAAPPSREPKVHAWDSQPTGKGSGAKGQSGGRGAPPPKDDEDNYGF